MRKSVYLVLGGAVLLLLVLAGIGMVVAGQPPTADDVDKDGMADSWERLQGFDPNNTADAGFDPDNDGATNLEEFEAKTDPLDAGSFPVGTDRLKTQNQALVAVGAGLALGIAGIASATGIGIAGASAVGVTAENPKLFFKTLLLQLLPMTQGIYALLVVFLLMVGVGLMGAGKDEMISNPAVGIAAVGIGLTVGLTGVSAIGQGITASASISAVGRNPAVFGRGLIFSAMSETLAIFGFLIAILFLVGFGFL